MSKRTIITCAVALLLIAGAFLSYYFDVRKVVKEANDIINGLDDPQEPKPEKRQYVKKEAKVVNLEPEINEPGQPGTAD